jgi:hypothetical protein
LSGFLFGLVVRCLDFVCLNLVVLVCWLVSISLFGWFGWSGRFVWFVVWFGSLVFWFCLLNLVVLVGWLFVLVG